MTKLLEILGCRYPIIQGPIGELNSPKLVAAISDAGAFGMLALGFRSAEASKGLVEEVKSLTNKPFGANLILHNPENEEILKLLAASGVKTVTTSAGPPDKGYGLIHDLGMKGLHVALTLNQAKRAQDAGVDGVIVSGLESGGLRSKEPESTNMVLIPLVADNVSIPIVAAGGIADSRGYRASLALGAQGVQIGTRFLVCAESPASDKWKQTVIDSRDGDTTLLPLSRMNIRVIITPKLKQEMLDPLNLPKIYDLKNLSKAWKAGDFDLFPASAGQVSALINDLKPVKEIIEEMVS